MHETPFACKESNIMVLQKISQAIQLMSRFTFW
jgi:hypothetical protein